jgi:hypothetical protein
MMRGGWSIVLVPEVEVRYARLAKADQESADLVAAAINQLAIDGPDLGRPAVDRIAGSKIHNMKEPRPGSRGRSEPRILFVFDYARRAILLAGGDCETKLVMARAWEDVRAELVAAGLLICTA